MRIRYSRLPIFLCIALLLSALFGLTAAADHMDAIAADSPEEPAPERQTLSCSEVSLYADERYIGSALLADGITYVPLRTFTECLLEEACQVEWDQETGTAVLNSPDLTISITTSDGYMVANGRYIYLADRVFNINGTIIVPIREIARVFGVDVEWNGERCSVDIDTEHCRLFDSGEEFYPEEDLYWLSRVISSEAGNQPLEGMIGVGNVVLNRANDESGIFSEGVYGVIFQQGQFDVVTAGSIYREPSEKAVAAAKLCLEGYNTVGDAKWFLNSAISSDRWFRTHRTFALTIQDHDFYS